MVKLYGFPGSTCTGRALYALAEKNVDYEFVHVNLLKGDNKKPEFVALQPFGQVPVLEDEDLTLFESRAIARYVAEKYASEGTPLYGKTLQERATVEQWLEVESQNFNPPISAAVYQLVVSKLRGFTPDESIIETNLKKLETVLDIYEDHLSKNRYLAGDFFSLADLSHVPYLYNLIHLAKREQVVTSRKKVNEWWLDISSRPSWLKIVDTAKSYHGSLYTNINQ